MEVENPVQDRFPEPSLPFEQFPTVSQPRSRSGIPEPSSPKTMPYASIFIPCYSIIVHRGERRRCDASPKTVIQRSEAISIWDRFVVSLVAVTIPGSVTGDHTIKQERVALVRVFCLLRVLSPFCGEIILPEDCQKRNGGPKPSAISYRMIQVVSRNRLRF